MGGKKKQNSMLKKVLIIGIFALFVLMSVLPSISGNINEEKNKAVKKSKIISTFNPNSDDDWIVNDQNNPCYKNYKLNKILNNKLKDILIVDQAVDSKCGMSSGSSQIRAYMPIGQSFKPLYECHHAIELYISDLNPHRPLAPIQISLRENNISGPFVPGANVTLNTSSGWGWRFFVFSSPINLTIDQTYVIDISTTTSRWGDKETQGYCYTRGIQYLKGAPSIGSDLYFRTYVLWPYPTANFTYQPINPTKYDFIHFNDESKDYDGYIVSWLWGFGDGNISTIQNPTHRYPNIGTYVVTLNVTDNDGLTDEFSKNITVIPNDPPNAPVISGQTKGKAREEYEYTFNATDPNDDPIMYFICWGDNHKEWTEYCDSGKEIKVKHTWFKMGIYNITAKAQDIYGAEGPEGNLEVTMPKNHNMWFLRWLDRFPILQKILDVLRLNN